MNFDNKFYQNRLRIKKVMDNRKIGGMGAAILNI